MVVIIEPVVCIVKKTAEVVFIDFVGVYMKFHIGQVKEDLFILFDGLWVNIEVVGDMGIAHRGIDNRNTESGIFNTDCTVDGEGKVDAILDYPMVAGLSRQECEFRKLSDESLDDFSIFRQEIRVCFYVPIVVGFFGDFTKEDKPFVWFRKKVYAVRMRTIKETVCGNENLYPRALGKNPFITFFGVGGFSGIDHVNTDFARESLIESLLCSLETIGFFTATQLAEDLWIVEEIIVCPVVMSIGDIVQGLCVYLIDRDLSADSEAQNNGIPVINAVTDDNGLDIVGIKIVTPVNVIGEGLLERVHKAGVV